MPKETEKSETKGKQTRKGLPMSEKSLAEWQKAFTDIEESITYCIKHPCKLK